MVLSEAPIFSSASVPDYSGRITQGFGMALFSVATYNIHQWIGTDRRVNPGRTIAVIKELDADIIALQEVAFPDISSGPPSHGHLAPMEDMEVVVGPALLREDHEYGNVVLTRYPTLRVDRIDLSVSSREPRGALDLDIDVNGIAVRVIATHLGLRGPERRPQIERLVRLVTSRASGLVILLGDFNFWFPHDPLLRKVSAVMGAAPAPRTYPSNFPVLRLDRIWVNPRAALLDVSVHRTLTARSASDHLPVKALAQVSDARGI